MGERKQRGSATKPTNDMVTNTWSESATRVLRERYLRKDEHGEVIETPDDMCWRVARAIASAEASNSGKSPEEIEAVAAGYADLMLSRRFMPNSPTLMNAGKGNNLQLSACFVLPVEDSLPGIFESVKHAAIVHQSGGGCIAGDAYIFTTFCGVESIAVLYERVRSTGKIEEDRGNHAVIDVGDLHIKTMALNPNDGSYEQAQVTHLWRYDVPLADQIRVHGANGLEVTTSRWHPFMVFDGKALVERRADDLKPGDILPTPNSSVQDQWPHHEYKEVAGVRLDEEIAWLLGYYLGDGNLGWAKIPESEPRREKLRWRLFDGRTASLEYARDVLARRFAVQVQVQQDARGLYSITTTNAGFIAQFQNLLSVFPGPKKELPFPEMIAKSPLSVVGAFLAGLVDSDGHVEARRDRVTITSQSHMLISKIQTLCSLLGLAPSVRSREPQGKGRSVVYEVKLAAEGRVAHLRTLIGPYLHDELKSSRLAEAVREHDHSTTTRLPIPFSAIEDILQSIGIATNTTAIHRQATQVGETEIWLQKWKEGLGIGPEVMSRLIPALRPLVSTQYQTRLDVLEHLMQGATVVTAIEAPTESVPFYDFTVADHSTYLAGKNGLTAIHNTGFAFSRLRPKGALVSTTKGVASGPVSFMKIFDSATDAVVQGGTRRGANMGILRVDHPDIEEFIACKLTGGITNFNISVAITDAFMDALEKNAEYDLIDPHTRQVVRRKAAREIIDRIVQAAWSSGDPGLVFIDRINASPANPTPDIEPIEATNPCGEQPLGPYDACNLGSINLGEFIDVEQHIDWETLRETVHTCVRFLDDVIDVNPYPLQEIRDKVHANRRIGLGVMGWADMLFKLGIRYDSAEAVQLGEKVMRFVSDASDTASAALVATRGVFPNWDRSIYKDGQRLRNSNRTTVAPTGTISIIADCSSGIEPIFALAFQHRVKQPDGTYRVLDFVNPIFLEALQASSVEDKDEIITYVKEHGNLHGHPAQSRPDLVAFITAHEVAPEWHIRMQAAFQKGVNSSISKTINLPNHATVEDVESAYMQAWQLGCLGITVFRDGSKGEQVLNVGVKKDEQPAVAAPAPVVAATLPVVTAVPVAEPVPAPKPTPRRGYTNGVKDRPDIVAGYTRQVRAPEGKVSVTLNSDDDGLLEVFVTIGKAGSDVAALAEALGRLISLQLRIESPLSQNERARDIAEQLRAIGGSTSIGFGMDRVRSLPDAVSRAILLHLDSVERQAADEAPATNGHSNGNGNSTAGGSVQPAAFREVQHYAVIGNLCPQCGCNTLVYAEGCKKCLSCGHSEC